MDQNKLKVLREIGYRVGPACGTCSYGNFEYFQMWGTCSLHTYEHLKHTGARRQLSTHLCGNCPNYELDEDAARTLEGFEELTVLHPVQGQPASAAVTGPSESSEE